MRKDEHVPGSVGEDLEKTREERREEGGGMGRKEVPKDGPSQGEYERPEAPPSGATDRTASDAEKDK